MAKLTPKQTAFIGEYLIDLNATQAAIRAGYSEKTARSQGNRMLTNVDIQSAISSAQKGRAKRTEITADYVLNTIKTTVERCAQAEPVVDTEGVPTGEYKFDPGAVLKGCELLGKHLAMWTDKQQIGGLGGGPLVTRIELVGMSDDGTD